MQQNIFFNIKLKLKKIYISNKKYNSNNNNKDHNNNNNNNTINTRRAQRNTIQIGTRPMMTNVSHAVIVERIRSGLIIRSHRRIRYLMGYCISYFK